MIHPDREASTRFDRRADVVDVVDEGLRAYMVRVYTYMAAGLSLTGAAALFAFMLSVEQTASGLRLTDVGVALYGSPLKWIVMLAPLGMVFWLSYRIHSMSASRAQTLFWVYAGMVGLSLGTLGMVYAAESIARTFFVTSAAFAGLSLYGYTTKRDLTAMGSFLIVGLFGIILAMLVNLFLESSGLQFAISVLGVLIFAGLTAYDTQAIKNEYYEGDHAEVMGRKAIMGALRLYLDFLNMFLFLLQLFGERR